MRNRLQPISTEEGARELLQKMVESGKITIEDLDQESPHSAFNREIVEKYYPAIKLKPHHNLLRDPKPIETVQASADPRDFDTGPASGISGTSAQILGQKEESIYSEVSLEHSERQAIPEQLPF
tara:strand:+ start:2650 stop:3021 length:372 start_codon:yes stop_codon:yes gene_type:complete